MTQTTFYPGKFQSSLCTLCYSGVTERKKTDCSGSNTTGWCDTCNSICNSAQNYGALTQFQNCAVSEHADIDFSKFNAVAGQGIHSYWTADKWNELQEVFELLYNIGQQKSTNQIVTPITFSRVCSFNDDNINSVITADQYNSFINASKHFNNSKTTSVTQNVTTISKSLSDQLDNLIDNNTFKSSVCDICNIGSQHYCAYNCSCNYNCCNYNCCDYNCSCNSPAPEE